MKGVQTKEEIEALRKAYGYEYSVPELEAIVYQQYVLTARNRNRAERDARLAAMDPPESLATEFRDDVIYIMSPGTDIDCGGGQEANFRNTGKLAPSRYVWSDRSQSRRDCRIHCAQVAAGRMAYVGRQALRLFANQQG